MTLTDLLWLATACYGIHILEEYQLNWRDWELIAAYGAVDRSSLASG